MKSKIVLIGALLMVLTISLVAGVSAATSYDRTYTLDADFDEGTLVNVNHIIADQLQLDNIPTPFEFIWVAASNRGTIVKIDTVTGQILGEYLSSPDNTGRNPSRTTVDGLGNVWSGNRQEAGGGSGSVVQIGLEENGQCVDRNTNGVIDTSTGLNDVKGWANGGGVDTNGGVSTALDECIIKYIRVSGDNIRHVSVDGNNNVWTGGHFGADNAFDLLDGTTGAILASFDVGCGGYGGLVDGNGVLWSSSRTPFGLLRYDTKNTITTADDTWSCPYVYNAYGLGIDSTGDIWHSLYTNNQINKVSSAGGLMGTFSTFGGTGDRGVAVTKTDYGDPYGPDNVWVANSGGSDVSRLKNDGSFVTTIAVGSTPTGVAVDDAGKVWATNLGSSTVSRIDPLTNSVDLTVDLNASMYMGLAASPYNYSDMTGSTLIAPPNQGTWTVVADSGIAGADWQKVSWQSLEPGDSSITVQVAANDSGPFGGLVPVLNGANPGVTGQYLKIVVTFIRSTTSDEDQDGVDDTPILYDLTISTNKPPDCGNASPSVDRLWPPNHKFHAVNVLDVSDPDGHMVTINIDSIFQDEPVDTVGDGTFVPDGQGVDTSTAHVRAERSGTIHLPVMGRIYHINFTATDELGPFCEGTVNVGVPHDVKDTPIDGGPLYDSTALSP